MEKKTSCKIGIAMTALVLAVCIVIGVVGCADTKTPVESPVETTETAESVFDIDKYYGNKTVDNTDSFIIIRDIDEKFDKSGTFSLDITVDNITSDSTHIRTPFENLQCALIQERVDTGERRVIGRWNTSTTRTAHFEDLPYLFYNYGPGEHRKSGYILYHVSMTHPEWERTITFERICGTIWSDFCANRWGDRETFIPKTELQFTYVLYDNGGKYKIEREDEEWY